MKAPTSVLKNVRIHCSIVHTAFSTASPSFSSVPERSTTFKAPFSSHPLHEPSSSYSRSYWSHHSVSFHHTNSNISIACFLGSLPSFYPMQEDCYSEMPRTMHTQVQQWKTNSHRINNWHHASISGQDPSQKTAVMTKLCGNWPKPWDAQN